jgi:hypothetical protein
VTICPHCGRDAPILYRGAVPFCTACGGLRLPLSGASVNLAGKPAKVGGAVAKVVGGGVLLVGLSAALGIGLLVYALGTMAVALAISLPIALVVLVAGLVLLKGGQSLVQSGAHAERTTREQALLALASHRGAVTAAEAAGAIGVSVADADATLTAMAKQQPDQIAVDIDDQGGVWYRAVDAPAVGGARRMRVGDGVRLGDARVERAPAPRARVREPGDAAVDDELDPDEAAERSELRR